jgi:hypothetical protein
MNFRQVFGDCLAKRPRLAAWCAMIGERASFKATVPKA